MRLWERLLWAIVGGLIGGSVSAYVTWRWTHKKWEDTARAFRTTVRYLAKLIQDPESVGQGRRPGTWSNERRSGRDHCRRTSWAVGTT